MRSTSSAAVERAVAHHLERERHAERLGHRVDLFDAPDRRLAIVVVGAGIRGAERRDGRRGTRTGSSRDVERADISRTSAFHASASRVAVENVSRPWPFASESTIGACTDGSVRPASRSHDASALNRRGIVIVEVASRGEQLDRLESVRGDLAPGAPAAAARRGTDASRRQIVSCCQSVGSDPAPLR